MKRDEWMQRIGEGTCAVIGLGISNRPLVEFLLGHGARVVARDCASRQKLGDYASDLESRGVKLLLEERYLDDLNEDIIFRTPGVRPDLPQITAALDRGAVLTSEMELFLDLTPARVIGVTGSDGKTTTTTLTHLILEASENPDIGRVYVGGNIGMPLLPFVEEMTARDVAVLELSSFQLMTVKRSAEVAAITNLSPNHLNWHPDTNEYYESKTNLYRHPQNRRAVFNADNVASHPFILSHRGKKTLFSSTRQSAEEFGDLLSKGDRAVYVRDGAVRIFDGEEERDVLSVSDIRLPGRHNLENYMTAIALTDGLATREGIGAVAREFGGVEHRLELVRTVGGVTYYNSSIDSSPNRTAAALSALPQRPIVICGGCDKGIPFDSLARTLCERARAIVLTGQTAPVIDRELQAASCTLPIYRESLFDNAVRRAREVAQEGDIVLLSPACTSFDAFANFMERGNRFKDIVNSF